MSQAAGDIIENIVPLHQPKPLTSAERSRLYRARKRLKTLKRKDRAAERTRRATAEFPQLMALPAPRSEEGELGCQKTQLLTVTPAVTPPVTVALRTTALGLTGVAFAIAALALVINSQTGWSFGRTPLASITFAGLSLSCDVLAVVLPATAGALWHSRRPFLAAAAWMAWALAAMLAVLASLGFAELNVSDTAAGRAATLTTSTTLADQRAAAIDAAKLAGAAATKAREAECVRRGPLCREREADERAALGRLSAAIAAQIPTPATIADADPQVTAAIRLATWAGLPIREADVVNLRLALMAMLPNIAGLLLAFAVGLVSPRSR